MSIAQVWAEWPQHLCLASFVQAGSLSKATAASLYEISEADVLKHVEFLEKEQDVVKTIRNMEFRSFSPFLNVDWQWLPPECTPAVDEARQKEIQEIQDASAKADNIKHKTLVKIVGAMANCETVETPNWIVPKAIEPDRGSMANLAETPSIQNAESM